MTSSRQGSVLLLTLFLIVLAAFAMSRFIEKAYGEILAEGLHAERDRFRIEAYSALEATIAVLHNVERMAGALHAPAQGWNDPLGLAGVELSPGTVVRVDFVDEMGKISLPGADRERLLRLFEVLDFDSIEAQELSDALMGWMSEEAAAASFSNHQIDYERGDLPYRPPYRTLRSFHELAAVAGFREAFFDGGVPNDRFRRFAELVSLYRFNAININAASPGVLRVWSGVGEQEAGYIESHWAQTTSDQPFFTNLGEAEAQLGVPLGGGYGVATQALRVNVTVTEGNSSFVLSAVVAPSSAAEALRPVPAPGANQNNNAGSRSRRTRRESPPSTLTGAPGGQEVPYPYTFLELRENETIL